MLHGYMESLIPVLEVHVVTHVQVDVIRLAVTVSVGSEDVLVERSVNADR